MPDHSPKKPAEPVVHDNTHLIEHLKQIHAAHPKGLIPEAADAWPDAKKKRQTMYIAGLAQKVNGNLVLTDKGRELIRGK